MKNWFKNAFKTCVPQAPCVVCKRYHEGFQIVCTRCDDLIKPLFMACNQCRVPLSDENDTICGQCLKQKPFYDEVICNNLFEEPLRGLIHSYKYQQALYLSSYLASLMLKQKEKWPKTADCIIPVPVHYKRLRARGYNHALELTKILSKKINVAFSSQLVQKSKNTPSQAGLSLKERKKNLSGVFQISPNHFRHVVIVDDLATSTSTANEMAKALKKPGVEKVSVWCCARASIRTHTAANHSSKAESTTQPWQ